MTPNKKNKTKPFGLYWQYTVILLKSKNKKKKIWSFISRQTLDEHKANILVIVNDFRLGETEYFLWNIWPSLIKSGWKTLDDKICKILFT